MSVYLDNAATSMIKPDTVAKSMYDFMVNNGTTSGRGSYKKAIQSDKLVYETRKSLASLFNFDKPKNVIFTSNVTEALNIAIRGILKDGDHVVTSSIEHNAVWRCLKTLEKDMNISVSKVKCNKEGYINLSDLENTITDNTKLIIFNHASNVIGTIQPIKDIGNIANRYNIPFIVDTAQTAGAYPIDIIKDNINILAFTGHKSLLGPMGTGGLIINWDGNINPLKCGGTGGDSYYEYQPSYYPNKLETGTLNVVGIVGLNEAIKYINNKGIDSIYSKEKALIKYTLEKLKTIKGIEVYGPKDPEKIIGVISFNVKDKAAEDIAYELDNKYDIMVRAGLHCSPCTHKVIGTEKIGTIRLSIGYFNKIEDIDIFIEALKEIVE